MDAGFFLFCGTFVTLSMIEYASFQSKKEKIMNKKKAVLSGLTGIMTAVVLGTTLSISNANKGPLRVLPLGEASGANVERTIVITDFVRNGFYYKALKEGRMSYFLYSSVTYELDNSGGYGYVELLPYDRNDIVNIDDGFVNFSCQSATQRIMYFSFEKGYDYYESEEAANKGTGQLPIYDFAKGSISSITIKMGSRNEGVIKTTDLGHTASIEYDSVTDSYVVTNLDNMGGIYIYSTEADKYFHIESITITYNC